MRGVVCARVLHVHRTNLHWLPAQIARNYVACLPLPLPLPLPCVLCFASWAVGAFFNISFAAECYPVYAIPSNEVSHVFKKDRIY